MRVGLVLHGDAPTRAELGLLRSCNAIVAADGGAIALLDAGIVPGWIVGDMDSLGAERLALAEVRGARAVRFPAAKDHTDGERALEQVLELGPSSVLILGAHGGRTAMFLANLALLRRCHEAGLEAVSVGHGEELQFVSPGRDLVVRGQEGRSLSLVPQGGDAVVTLRGLRYPLQREQIPAASARGVSNVIEAPEARVVVHEGLVLAVLEP